MKIKAILKGNLEKVRLHLFHSKKDAAVARLIKPVGFSNRFNRLMAMHRTKFNLLAGLASFTTAGFFAHIIIGFVVLGISLFTAEYLSGGKT